MSRSNPPRWRKLPVIWSYGIAGLSVIAALIISRWPAFHLRDAPVSLFLCAVMFSAWFGGVGPGLFATALSAFAFDYYVLPPMYSLGIKPEEIPRFVAFTASALFVGSLSAAQRSAIELLRRAHNELKGTVQELRRTNETLQAESRERKHVENRLRHSEAYLAEAQRLSQAGSFGWRVSDGKIVWSEETFRIFEYDRAAEPTLELILRRVHPDDRTLVQQVIDRAAQDGTDFDHAYRLLMPDGSVKHVHIVAHAERDKSDELEFVGAVMDVTERKRAGALLDGQNKVLEMIATSAPLKDVLVSLVHLIESNSKGMLCSILLLDEDGQHMRHGAAPSLPEPYTQAIDGAAIGPQAGSCGTAAYLGKPVIVSDIQRDPLWVNYRELATAHGLRACWSTPIVSDHGKVLGTFAMYYREVRSPDSDATRLIAITTHIARIAIEHKQAEERIIKSAGELRLLTERLINAQEEERKRIARELHDDLGQQIAGLSIWVSHLKGQIPAQQYEAREQAEQLQRRLPQLA